MIQLWEKRTNIDGSSDFMHTNDAGEDYNISEALRSMNQKILDCMGRVLDDRALGSLIQVDPATWLLKGEGFS